MIMLDTSVPTRRVLLIEDNPGDARLVTAMLDGTDGEHLEVTCVRRLADAAAHLDDLADGCVLVDLGLPDADGLESVDRLLSQAPDLPIIVLTGHDDIGLAVAALQRGAQDYLIKGRVDGLLLARAVRYAVERKHAETALAHQALHDPLTGLPNRLLFVDRLTQALARSARSRRSVAVLFVDLDRFKVVNDSLGHAAGDRALMCLAERLTSALRPGDTVARFGGDEFTVLCDELDNDDEAGTMAERIASVVATPIDLNGAEMVLSASIGIALGDGGPSAPAETLIRNADAAMYRAKERGRSGWVLFNDEIHRRAVERLDTEVALRRALETGGLRVHYQPIVHSDTGELAGFEALVRWQHPTRGLLMPHAFIDLAEETGLIEPLDAWVLDEACRQARRLLDIGPADSHLTMTVNVTGRELARPDFPLAVANTLQRNGLPSRHLCLEMTESTLVDDADTTHQTLAELRDLGVHLAVDDFGSGYSTLGNLKRFPVDVIKIDRSFVVGLGRDQRDMAITMATVRLAKALGLTTIAEGVEEIEQLEVLRMFGCDMVQGYGIARPLPAEEAERRWAATMLEKVG